MTEANKELLLTDICGRLQFGVFVDYKGVEFLVNGVNSYNEVQFEGYGFTVPVEEVKPYLIPLSKMTNKQKKMFENNFCVLDEKVWIGEDGGIENQANIMYDGIKWLNKNYYDYRGLIKKGLAISADNKRISALKKEIENIGQRGMEL